MKAKAIMLIFLVLVLLTLFSHTSETYVISDEIGTNSAITETVQNEALNTSKEVYIVLLTQGELKKSLKSEIYKKVKELGYTPIFPNKVQEKYNGQLIVVYSPVEGVRNGILHKECFAYILLYYSSIGDMMSFDQVVERMSSEMNALALDKVATEVSKEAQENVVKYHETAKIGVTYWKNIRVKSSQLNEEQCWKLLAQEIVKIPDDWMTHKN